MFVVAHAVGKVLVMSLVSIGRKKILDALLGPPEPADALADSHDDRYRIIDVRMPDLIEVVDQRGLRQVLPLSYGARETVAQAMRDHSLSSPLGLLLRREPFEVEGVVFHRWAVADDEPAVAKVSNAAAAALC